MSVPVCARTRNMTISTLSAALAYAALGFSTFPLKPKSKHPATTHGVKDARKDWGPGTWPPASGVGIACGDPSGIIVVDIDPRNGGDEAYAALVAEHGPFPETVECLTGGGGRHLYYRGVCSTHKVAGVGAVDVRGTGSYVVAPPSIHPDTGRPYAWEARHDPTKGFALADAPAWLLVAPERPKSAAKTLTEPDFGSLSRNTLLFLQLGAPEGERNNRLFAAACDMNGCGIDRGDAERQLTDAGGRCGLSPLEVSKSISSAYGKARGPARPADNGTGNNGASIPGHLEIEGPEEHPVDNSSPDQKQGKKMKPSTAANRPRFTNVAHAYRQVKGKSILVNIHKPLDQISAELLESCNGWPKSAGGILFAERVDDAGIKPRWLSKVEDLFAWIQERTEYRWCTAASQNDNKEPTTPPKRDDFMSHLRNSACERYIGVADLPHYPEIPGVFYLPIDLPAPTGKCLAEFLESLNVETEKDRGLMLAALLTLFWGGAAGTRPAFVFTSDHGRGVGKSATPETLADIAGGHLSISSKEPWEKVTSRLLGDDGLGYRVVFMDNMKGKGGGQDIEALITSRAISGWRPYHGQFSRVNLMTFFLSANTPRLTRDLSDRAVVIKIGPSKHQKSFIAWVTQFVREHRLQLVADLLDILRGPDRCTIPPESRDRFQAWQNGVLAKIANGAALAALAAERRGGVDADDEDAEDVAKAIHRWVETKGSIRDDGTCRISRDEMLDLLIEAKVINDSFNKNGVFTFLGNLMGSSGPLSRLSDGRFTTGRCWVWRHNDPDSIPI